MQENYILYNIDADNEDQDENEDKELAQPLPDFQGEFGSELRDLTGTNQEADVYSTYCSSAWFPPKLHKRRKTTTVK